MSATEQGLPSSEEGAGQAAGAVEQANGWERGEGLSEPGPGTNSHSRRPTAFTSIDRRGSRLSFNEQDHHIPTSAPPTPSPFEVEGKEDGEAQHKGHKSRGSLGETLKTLVSTMVGTVRSEAPLSRSLSNTIHFR
jgi:hypothetical protein